MSVAFQEHLGQEEKSTSQNISQIPCPSSLLAAASTIKCIMDAADAERKQRAFRDAEGGHEQEGEIDCRWTAGGTASCGQEEEEQHYRRGEIRFHGEQQRPHQHPLHVHHKRTIPLQQRELALQRVPSRRPGRPFRKRGRQVSCREIHGDNASAEVHLQQRLATAGTGKKPAAITGRPIDISVDCAAPQIQQEERGTAFAGARAAPPPPAAPGNVAFSRTTTSVLISPPTRDQFRVSVMHPPSPPARSTTRVLSSETYLRRLFVTASLAHVLSLELCLPRSFPMRRKVSCRVRERRWGEEDEDEEEVEEEKEEEEREEDDGRVEAGSSARQGSGLAGQNIGDEQRVKGYADAGRGDVCGIRDNNITDDKETAVASLLAAAEQNSSGSFKLVFPVTLVDAAGQLWSMTYVSTTRDNLHSGRLVEGWETFCCANKLRIGDEVDFIKVEAHEQEGGRLCKEAVARVVLHKRNCRNK